MNDDSLALKIAFSQVKGLIGNTARELLNRVGSVDAFFALSRSQLSSLIGTDSPIFADDYRSQLVEKSQNEANFVRGNGIKTYFIGDKNYPNRLECCDDGPSLLYELGEWDINSSHVVGIVGTRHATPYGVDFTRKLVDDLSELVPNITIVSGLAFGIDVAAHKAAIAAGVPTVGVVAHGLNMIYPAEHRSIAASMIEKGGALITEYVSSSKIYRRNFLDRNRIVAALCDAVVVVESDYKGGSMSTARIASLYNREVFAVPGRVNDIYSRGSNRLIANNIAMLLTSATDLTGQMGWQTKSKKEETPTLFPALTPETQAIYDFILEHPDATANDMCVALGMSYATLSDRLFKLELDDVIVALPGGRFAPSIR